MMHDELSALEVIKKGELLLIMHFYYFFALLDLKALSTAVPVYFIHIHIHLVAFIPTLSAIIAMFSGYSLIPIMFHSGPLLSPP